MTSLYAGVWASAVVIAWGRFLSLRQPVAREQQLRVGDKTAFSPRHQRTGRKRDRGLDQRVVLETLVTNSSIDFVLCDEEVVQEAASKCC